MSQPTLGLLEKLRPPSGYRTKAALGATYSADLLTCMAVLTTMDGGDGEELRYGRIEALRALERLRGKVLICHQAGRISRRDGAKFPSLALLDRILVPIRVAQGGSFHPKVWLAIQENAAARKRFVLIVSSRNVSTSTDWDLGMALEGWLDDDGDALPRVPDFVERVLKLARRSEELPAWSTLAKVRWKRPRGVQQMTFDFQPGGHRARLPHAEWKSLPAAASRLLLLSPFIDDQMIAEAARHWKAVPQRRLVAGTESLITVALGSERQSLLQLRPQQMAAAMESEESAAPDGAEDSEEEEEPQRALHAKVIAIEEGRRATIILGSSNLTSTAWCGASTEAFLRINGHVELCQPLWDWALAHAQQFVFPVSDSEPPQKPLLEKVKDKIHTHEFRLEDRGGVSARLTLQKPAALALPAGVRMEVSRYTMPQRSVPFPNGESSVEIPACPTALRTRFIVCTLRHGDDETAFIAEAEIDPPIDDTRDSEFVARFLGLRELLAYLQSLGTGEEIAGIIEGEGEGEAPDLDSHATRTGYAALSDNVHLEGLLRQLVTDPKAFAEMDSVVTRYEQWLKKDTFSVEDRTLWENFLGVWAAIREGFAA